MNKKDGKPYHHLCGRITRSCPWNNIKHKGGAWSLTDYLGIVQHIADQWL